MEIYGPVNNTTVSLSVTQSNTQGTLTPTASGTAYPNRLLVVNWGPNPCYFRVGAGAQTAVTTDTPILAYQAYLVVFNSTMTGIAAICDTGLTTTLKASQMYAA